MFRNNYGALDHSTLDALVSGTQKWREATKSLSLSATLHAQLPELIPERRRVMAADIADATLSSLGERYARDAARFGRLHEEMLGIRSRPNLRTYHSRFIERGKISIRGNDKNGTICLLSDLLR